MNKPQRMALISRLAEKLGDRGSWCGETHLQKAMYLLRELFGIDPGFDFMLYKHGPFSFDLRDELTEMTADGLLELQPRPPYGPGLVPTQGSKMLQGELSNLADRYNRQIDFVARKIADKGVVDLERLATALYVNREKPHASRETRAKTVHELKPHVSLEEATAALEAIDEIVKEAEHF